jgi:mycothione reductase
MHFDLAVIGTGSGNSVLTPDHDDWKVAIIERGAFGGTCLNRGCIPSKMLVLAADLVEQARTAHRLGVDLSVDGVRWLDIRDRVFGRIDAIADGGEDYRHGLPNVTVFKGTARFVGERQIQVGNDVITADNVVLAAGARPWLPPIPGLQDVPFHTSDTVMRLDAVPGHLTIVGGGFIAVEMAHVFEAFGSQVTLVHRRDTLLRAEDHEVARRFTELAGERYELALDAQIAHVATRGERISVEATVAGEPRRWETDCLLVATGRVPNADELEVARAGIAVDADGYVVVDQHMATTAAGVWALGDICNPAQLKHTANAEARVVAHNVAHPDDPRAVDLWPTPHAVFSSPQVAAVGATEEELVAAGTPYVKSVRDYGGAAYGWALEDTTSFCKLLADPDSRQLLGAHLIGPQAATLIQQLIQGMRFGQTVDEMASAQLYIHPALPEVVEQALLDLS